MDVISATSYPLASCQPVPLAEKIEMIDLARLRDAQGDRNDCAWENELKERWVVIVTCGFEISKVDQYKQLKDQGLKLFVVDEPDNCVAIRLEELNIAHHVPVDMTPDGDLLDRVLIKLEELVRGVYDKGERPNANGTSSGGLLSACWTIWDDGVCLSARVAEALGLINDTPEVVDICHNKFLSRRTLEESGVLGPKSAIIGSLKDIEEKTSDMRFPLIIKPLNGAASIGLHKVESSEELKAKWPTMQAELQEIYGEKELMGFTFDNSMISNAADLLLFCAEEFISGEEYDVDVIIQDGKPVYGNIGQDWKFRSEWMVERGMHHPATLSDSCYRRVISEAQRLAVTLGCVNGQYHIEVKDDPDMGVQLIECNPRMGGGPVWNFHKTVWDVDLLKEGAMVYLGLPVSPKRLEQPLGLAVSLFLFSDVGGTLADNVVDVNQELKNDKYVTFFQAGLKGDEIRGWLSDKYPTHLGRLDLFIPREDPLFETGIEWGISNRNRIAVPLTTGVHYDNNDDKVY